MAFIKPAFIFLVLTIHFGCNQVTLFSEKNVFSRNEKATWIQDKKKLPQSDTEFYLDDPAPIFRKTFFLKNLPKKATLNITAAGYYKAYVNTYELENNVLDPIMILNMLFLFFL